MKRLIERCILIFSNKQENSDKQGQACDRKLYAFKIFLVRMLHTTGFATIFSGGGGGASAT